MAHIILWCWWGFAVLGNLGVLARSKTTLEGCITLVIAFVLLGLTGWAIINV